ncbi:hypothethical protein (plasmid) [Ralstonia solanacearum CMR15]|nr:hypothethical protein [Ralstonia solanacearum CMR15]
MDPFCYVIHDMFQPGPEIIELVEKIVATPSPSVNQCNTLNCVVSRDYKTGEIIAVLPLCEGKQSLICNPRPTI